MKAYCVRMIFKNHENGQDEPHTVLKPFNVAEELNEPLGVVLESLARLERMGKLTTGGTT